MATFPFAGSYKGTTRRPRAPLPGLMRPKRRVPDAIDDAPPGPPKGSGTGNGPGLAGPPMPRMRRRVYGTLTPVPGPMPDHILLGRATKGSPSFTKSEMQCGYRKLK